MVITDMRKIFPYLILNFFVSAVAILIVILIWNATHKNSGMIRIPTPVASPQVYTSSPPPSVIPLEQKTFEIQTLIGPGDLKLERVQLVSVADTSINLQGWKIVNEQGAEYVFPSVTVFPGGGISIFTRSGVNTAVEYFWGRDQAVWASGETVKLLDPENQLRASYLIP